MRLLSSIFIILFFSLLGKAQKTAIASLTTSQDVLIHSQNIQAELEFLAFGAEGDKSISRSILKFDLKDLPVGKLKHVTLSLNMASEGTGIISIHKVLEDWKGSFYNTLDYANWQSTGLGQKEWSLQGGDFWNSPSGRAIFNDNETLDVFGPQMKLDIEEWTKNPSSNFGWLIMGSENSSNSKTLFHSGKNLTQGPVLTLIYELPDSCYAAGGTATIIGSQTVIAKCPDHNELNVELEIHYNQGENKIWLVCDEQGDILGFSINTSIDALQYGDRNLNIYHLSFNGEIIGASIGNNVRNLVGCHALSNKIEVLSNAINGGEITTTFGDKEVTICPINFEDITNLKVKDQVGVYSIWAVMDHEGFIKILDVEKPLGLKDLSPGNYQIRHLSYHGNLSGLFVDNKFDKITGCFDWSNAIDITLLDIEACRLTCSLQGSIINGEVLTICPSSSIGASFHIDSLSLSKNYGAFAIWLITDRRGNTLETLPDIDLSNYKIAEGETVYLFHITYNELNFQFRNNIYDLNGCYGISNGLPITGVYTHDCPLICEIPEPVISSTLFPVDVDLCHVSNIEDLDLASNIDGSYPFLYVVRNSNDKIVSIGDIGMALEFEENGIYNLTQVLSYEDSAFLNLDRNVLEANTCFAISNNIRLIQSTCPFICKAPESIEVSESNTGNVNISWERIEGARRYEFEVGFGTDTTDLTMLSTSRNSIKLSNPSQRTIIFRIRTQCSEEGFSPYSTFKQYDSGQGDLATSRNSNYLDKSKRIGISPNPATSKISLEYETFEQSAIAEIYDATGRFQLKQVLDPQRGIHNIDISVLKTGIHFIKIRDSNGIMHQDKFIKIQ
jgi:hypothetical protein